MALVFFMALVLTRMHESKRTRLKVGVYSCVIDKSINHMH